MSSTPPAPGVTGAAAAPLAVDRVEVEHHGLGAALGIGEARPRLSWRVAAGPRDWHQAGYELRLLGADGGELACTGPRSSADQVLVAWPFAPLVSAQRAAVQVRVTAADGATSGWSVPEPVEAGLLAPEDWSAVLITADAPGEPGAPVPAPAPRVRRGFTVRDGLVAARLRLSAHGLVQAWVNGVRVGDEVLAPGWTAYRERLRYRTHDVTALLREGENAVAAMLGNGWWRGRLAWDGRRALYGTRRALLAQLELTYADGRTERVVSDRRWRARAGHVLHDDLYDGEHADLARADDAWLAPGFDDAGWPRVQELGAPTARLDAADGPPVRAVATVPAVSASDPALGPTGSVLVDFGQDLVGWVRLRVRGRRGQRVVVRHAEVLEHGALGVRPLRSALATDTYDLAGGGEEVLEPGFTVHGFRYAEVTGAPGLRAQDVEAVVVSSDLERTGWFTCSEPDLERFHANVVASMRGNFLDVPTDCPQRDERLGWTGDVQVFCPTAAFLSDACGFLVSWLRDLAAEQVDGAVPFVVPDVLPGPPVPAAAWGDAGVVVPTVLHQQHGDEEVLARQWPSMLAWVERLLREAGQDLRWTGGFQFGDWLDPTAPPEDAAAAQADPDVVATAHLVRGADLLARAAAVLGRPVDAARWSGVAARARAAFVAEYVTAGGRVLSDCQTVYALAICWDLLPDAAARDRAGDRLADLVRTAGFRIATGFVGTPLVTDALTATGHLDVAYRLLLQRRVPSWLYPVTMGATTVWERWDSMLPDGSVNPGEMTSFNHYALGAVADWLHRTVAGLAPGAPGYRELEVRPRPGGGLTRAGAVHTTPYGDAAVSWRVEGATWHLDVVVPPGTTAVVHLPDASAPQRVGSGEHAWSLPAHEALPGRGARVTLRSTTRELLDSVPAWAAVAPVLVAAGVGADDAEVARRLAPSLDRSVEAMAAEVARSGSIPVGAALVAAVEGALSAALPPA